LSEKKQKFLEGLLTLGSLLAVFLGLAIGKFPFFLPYLITFGVAFTVSAFISYTGLIFRDEFTSERSRLLIGFANTILGVSFGGLVTVGTGLVLSQIQGAYNAVLVYVGAGLVLTVSLLGTVWLINKVMNLPDEPIPQQA